MAKLKLHIESVPLDLVKEKIAQYEEAVSKENESSPNNRKAGHGPKTAIKNLRAG